jgi:hypothetical protein
MSRTTGPGSAELRRHQGQAHCARRLRRALTPADFRGVGRLWPGSQRFPAGRAGRPPMAPSALPRAVQVPRPSPVRWTPLSVRVSTGFRISGAHTNVRRGAFMNPLYRSMRILPPSRMPTLSLDSRSKDETMQKRKLGNSNLEVSAIGLGCMGMSDYYGEADEAESIATVPPRDRSWRQLLRHCGGLWPLCQ